MNTKQLSIIAAQYGLHSPQYNTALMEFINKKKTGKGILSTVKKGVKRGLSIALKIALVTGLAITSILGTVNLLVMIEEGYKKGDNMKNIIKTILENVLGSVILTGELSSSGLNKVAQLVKEFFDAKYKSLRGKGIYKTVKKRLSSALKVALVLGAVLAILSGGTYRYGDAIKARFKSKYVESVVNRNKSVIDNSMKNIVSQVERRTGYKLTGNELTKLWTMLKELFYGKPKESDAELDGEGQGQDELDELDPPIIGTTVIGRGIKRMKNKSRHLNLN